MSNNNKAGMTAGIQTPVGPALLRRTFPIQRRLDGDVSAQQITQLMGHFSGNKDLHRNIYAAHQDPTLPTTNNQGMSAATRSAIKDLSAALVRVDASECEAKEIDAVRASLDNLVELIERADEAHSSWQAIEASPAGQQILKSFAQVCHGQRPPLRNAMMGARRLLFEADRGQSKSALVHPSTKYSIDQHPQDRRSDHGCFSCCIHCRWCDTHLRCVRISRYNHNGSKHAIAKVKQCYLKNLKKQLC